MQNYDPKHIEPKWQKYWEEQGIFKTPEKSAKKDKMYILPQLPYPSGSGLHVGHAEVYTACDIFARYQRMNGKKVLQVIGWDSFGLPAENYAIKTNVHPRVSTENAIDNFRAQIKSLGISVDWSREVGSHNPDYYKWTQWFFLLMYKRGLAYRKMQSVNWCGSCKTVLANEQVTPEGVCERCETQVIQKEMEQWYLKITQYADRLLKDLDKIDWPEETKKRQRDWIGRSEGATIRFPVHGTTSKGSDERQFVIEVFTTRPDTIFGATYMVLAPEHHLVQKFKDSITNWKDVEKYIQQTAKKTELDRQQEKEKTGVELKGIRAVNPANGEEIPVWIADYVLATYGTGAIMAVPAHDERDFEFAKKFQLPIKDVVARLVGVRKKEGVDRPGAYSIIKNGNRILVLYDKKHGYYRVPGGAHDDGEQDEAALFRELAEETGYVDVKIKNYLATIEACSYTSTRKQYQHRMLKAYEVELLSTKKAELPKEEQDRYDYHWMTLDDAEISFKKNLQEIGEIELIRLGFGKLPFCFTEDGVSINSDFLNGLTTKDAKEKIIAWLEENGAGARQVQYKLRDWSVSRQRFWGAPIPMLYNEHRAQSKKHYVFIHGRASTTADLFWPWLKQELESRGHEIAAFDLEPLEPKADLQAESLLRRVVFSENSVIIAHSHGGPVAFRILEQLPQPIAKLVLVDAVLRPEFNDKPRPDVAASTNWKFDFEKIKKNVQETVVVADSKHPVIPREQLEELRDIFDGRIVYARADEAHFQGAKEPAVLEESLVRGLMPVPEKDLPVVLPDDVDFKPTGQSPLTYSADFQKGVEEKYGVGWKREVDTLDTFMCSSWYYYRYLDPHNDAEFASPKILKQWMPVDFYLGGEEHVNGHLLYARFFTKVLFDAGYIDFDEPFAKHRHQGLILGEDSRKMSKRWNNVVNPTDVVREFGADTCRMYEMFMGPLEDAKPWSTNGVKGLRRFLDKVWRLREKLDERSGKREFAEIESTIHKTLKKVGEDLAELKFNTAIAKLMELVNAFLKEEAIDKKHFEMFVLMLAPFAPHVADELWGALGNKGFVSEQKWPKYDESKIQDTTITLAVQVNGKVRDTFEADADIFEDEAKELALASEKVQKWLDGKEPKKIIYVKGKLISVVL